MSWLDFWTVFLVAALVAFAGLGVVVSVRGFGDALEMLRRLARRRDEGRP